MKIFAYLLLALLAGLSPSVQATTPAPSTAPSDAPSNAPTVTLTECDIAVLFVLTLDDVNQADYADSMQWNITQFDKDFIFTQLKDAAESVNQAPCGQRRSLRAGGRKLACCSEVCEYWSNPELCHWCTGCEPCRRELEEEGRNQERKLVNSCTDTIPSHLQTDCDNKKDAILEAFTNQTLIDGLSASARDRIVFDITLNHLSLATVHLCCDIP